MTTKKTVDALWRELSDFIAEAYKDGVLEVRDYADQGWRDSLSTLLQREIKNEKQHNSGRPAGWSRPISFETASKMILLGNIVDGAEKTEMIPASFFLELRRTACEAMVVGWLIRKHLTGPWIAAVKRLDYSAEMQKGWKQSA